MQGTNEPPTSQEAKEQKTYTLDQVERIARNEVRLLVSCVETMERLSRTQAHSSVHREGVERKRAECKQREEDLVSSIMHAIRALSNVEDKLGQIKITLDEVKGTGAGGRHE